MKKWLMGALTAICIILLCSYLFHLNHICSMVLGAVTILLVPAWIRIWDAEKKNKREYYEMTVYAEMLICSYKRLGHTKLALMDCAELFPEDGVIGQALQAAIQRLKTGEGVTSGSITEKALDEISGIFYSRRIHMIHHFIACIDNIGGHCEDAMDRLLADMQMWKQRTMLYHKKKQYIGRECLVASLLAILLSYISQMLIPGDMKVDFLGHIVYQVSSTAVLSMIFLTITGIWYGVGGSYMDEPTKDISGKKSEIAREFPYWLLSVTLYLEQESVYNALLRSKRETHGIFRKEVESLIREIYDDPTSLKPYMHFFEDLKLPEIQTGMKLLYSVNINGYLDANKQVQFLVEQNNRMMDQSEREFFRTELAGFRMMRQIPMILAGAKAVTDVLVFLMIALKAS